MIDLSEIEHLSGQLWMLREEGKSFKAASIIIDAIKVLAESQNEIQAELKWIRRKLNNEI